MADFEVIFVDIGEGDSTLMKLPNGKYALMDVFRCEDHGIDLFKLLDDRLPDGRDGKKQLDYLIITHAHDDHIRGMKELVERYDVREIWAPRYNTDESLGEKFDEFKEVMDSHPNVEVPVGSRTPWRYLGENDEATVRCFSPPGYIDVDETLSEQDQRDKVHEFCGVFKVEYEGVSVMFAGDSDLNCWKRIIGYYENVPDEHDITVVDSTVLHATHHGSYTFFKDSKDDELWLDGLKVIDPEAVIVSVGDENKYGHPHKNAMKTYRDHVGEENVHETRDEGTIVLEITGKQQWTLRSDDGEFTDTYGWTDDEDDDNGGGSSRGGTPPIPPVPSRPRPKPNPDSGRTYG